MWSFIKKMFSSNYIKVAFAAIVSGLAAIITHFYKYIQLRDRKVKDETIQNINKDKAKKLRNDIEKEYAKTKEKIQEAKDDESEITTDFII